MTRWGRAAVLLTLAIVAVGLSGCAMSRGATDVTNAPTGPGTEYPCGIGNVSCFPVDGSHTCCWHGQRCAHDDDGPYCHGDLPSDFADPTTFGARPKRVTRFGEPTAE